MQAINPTIENNAANMFSVKLSWKFSVIGPVIF